MRRILATGVIYKQMGTETRKITIPEVLCKKCGVRLPIKDGICIKCIDEGDKK